MSPFTFTLIFVLLPSKGILRTKDEALYFRYSEKKEVPMQKVVRGAFMMIVLKGYSI